MYFCFFKARGQFSEQGGGGDPAEEKRVPEDEVSVAGYRWNSALRVIQRQGKLRLKRLVNKWCKWITKMKISQNL